LALAVEAFAIEPVATTVFVFDAVIVTRGFIAQPITADAFWTFSARYFAQHTPPTKAYWRAVGNRGYGVDALGASE
jgi:hypothetical protein